MTTLTLYQYLVDHHIDITQFDHVTFIILFKGVSWTFTFNVNAQEYYILADLINVHNLHVELNATERLLILRDQVAINNITVQHGLSAITSNVVELACNFKFFDNFELYSSFARSLLSGISGCYYFYNLVNDNGYVDSSIDIRGRLISHAKYRYLIKSGDNQIIHSALAKYGPSNFALLGFLLSSGLPMDLNNLASLAQEQFLLYHLLNITYNVSKFADRSELGSGANHPSYNTGFPLYLYKVQADDWYISKGEYYTPVTREVQEFLEVLFYLILLILFLQV